MGIIATAEEINILHGVVISGTILNYLEGVRSNVQQQLDNKSSNTHTHNVEFTGTASATKDSGVAVASAAHTHEYTSIKEIESNGSHNHTVNVPTQTFESDGSGKYVLVFGMQSIAVSEAGAHVHNLISESVSTSAPNETTEVASKEHTHEVAGSGTTGTPQ